MGLVPKKEYNALLLNIHDVNKKIVELVGRFDDLEIKLDETKILNDRLLENQVALKQEIDDLKSKNKDQYFG